MIMLKRVWWLLLLSVVVFGMTLNTIMVGRPTEKVIMLHVKIMGISLGILAVGILIFAFFIRNFLVKFHLKASPLRESPSNEAYLDKIYLASILQWALFTGIAIYGFVVANIGNSLLYGLPFFALTSFGFGLTYPKEARLIGIVKKVALRQS